MSEKILIGIESIMAYCNLSKRKFYDFVKLGLPARQIDGMWYAHADNIDRYFQRITNVSMRGLEIPEEVE